MKTKKIISITVALILLMTMFAGCGGGNTAPDSGTPGSNAGEANSGAPGEKVHPELNLRINTDMQTPDIHFTASPHDYYISTQIFEGFVRFSEGGADQSNPEPCLASEWSVNEAGDEVIFTLREGVKWHDGTPLTVEDAIFSIERWKTSSFTASKVGMIDHAEKIDDRSLKVVLTNPYPTFVTLMCGWPFRLVQQAAVEVNGIDQPMDGATVIGTGPYKFEKNVIGEGVTLVANEEYWDGAPYFEKINFKLIADETTAMTALFNGEIDVNLLPTGLDVQDVEKDSNLQLVQVNRAGTHMVYFDITKAPMNNIKFRQAVNHAINKEKYVDLVWDGMGIAGAKQLVGPEEEGYIADLPGYPYDVEKAKQLIQESGLSPAELTVDFTVSPAQGNGTAFAAVFKEDMAAIGVEVNIIELESGNFMSSAIIGKEYEMLYWPMMSIPYCPPHLRNVYYRPGASLIPWVEELDKVEELTAKANSDMNQETRVATYQELEQFLSDQALLAPVAYMQGYYGAAKELRGMAWEPGTLVPMNGKWYWEE